MALRQTIKKLITDLLPAIYADQLASREAVIVNIGRAKQAATMNDEFMPVFAVDVQLLNAAGEVDERMPILESLPLPLSNGGFESGFVGQPHEGLKVVVGFIYGLASKPYIQTILSTDVSMPGLKRGDMTWTQGAGISQSIDRAGNWKRETTKNILDSCDSYTVQARQSNEMTGNKSAEIKGHWLNRIHGMFKLRVMGSVSLLSGARFNIAAAETLNLKSATDVNVEASNNINIESVKDISVKSAENIKSTAVKENHIIAPKVYIGSASVDLVAKVESLAGQVSALDDLVKAHTHGNGNLGSPTTAPVAWVGVKSDVDAIKADVAKIKV